MSKGRYPNWVHRYVGDKQKAKRVNGNYYLYNVEGGREQYVGVITEEGIRYKKQERVSFGPWETYEYGGSRALLELCPSAWKDQRGPGWKDDLLFIISEVNPKSYLLRDYTPNTAGKHLVKKNLMKFLWKEYQITIEDLFTNLGGILLLINEATGEMLLSKASNEALAFAETLNVKLEVML